MKKTLLAATMLISACIATAQDYHKIDSLKTILNTLPPLNGTDADTTRMQVCLDIGYLYEYYIPDSAIWWYSSITDTSFNAEKIKLFQKNAIINAEGLMYIGIVAYYLGYYSSAILYYERSLKIFEELGYKSGISSSLNNLGNVASLQGNYVAAQSYFERSLKVWEKIGDKSSISECLNNLGNVASEQGNYSAATLYYERSLKILEELGEITGISTCIQNLGCVALDQGNYSLAILYFNHSLKIFEELGNKSGISSCLNNLGVAAKNQGNYAAAISCFERSLKICEEIGEKARLASNYPALAKAYIQMNMEEKALPLYLTSQEITISLLKDNFTILSEVEKSLYLDKTKDVFNNINEFNLHYGNQFDSLAGDCYNNELILKGLLLNSTGSMLNAVYNSQDTALKNTYFRLKQYRDEISALQGVPIEEREKDMESLEKLANDEERKLVKMSSQFNDMQKLYSYRWQDVQLAMKPGEAAVEFLEINHTILRSDTCKNDSITYAALVLKPGDKYPVMVPLCSYDELSALFFSGSIESSSELLAERGMIFKNQIIDFATCYQLIWQPLENYLNGIKTVYFAPAGLLNKVSFAALITPDNNLLLDKLNLISLTSTKVLIEKQQNDPFRMSNIALFGGISYETDNLLTNVLSQWHQLPTDSLNNQMREINTNATIAWKYLPGTLSETENIQKILQKKKHNVALYSGSQATEEVFKSLQFENAPEIIHVATHGFSIPLGDKQNAYKIYENSFVQNNNPLFRTGLLFAGAERTWDKNKPVEGIEDGILTAYEVSNMNLSNTQLVVLSACETGLGEVKGSEGVYGLQRAFKMAGVQHIIMSLWSVPDKETGIFMEKFYKNLVKLNDVRKAFTKTQHYMRKKYEPYYWAAFVLVE